MEAEVKTKSDNYIQLKNESIIRFEIKDFTDDFKSLENLFLQDLL